MEDALVASGIVPPVGGSLAAANGTGKDVGDGDGVDPFDSVFAASSITNSVSSGGGPAIAAGAGAGGDPVQELAPLRYDDPEELPKALREGQDVLSKLDRMLEDEEAARKRGSMTVEEYEKVKREMAERQMERDRMLRALSKEEQQALFEACAIRIQRIGRGRLGRNKASRAAEMRRLAQLRLFSAIKVQSQIRRVLAKKRFDRIKDIFLNNMKYAHCAQEVQRTFRGHLGRRYFTRVKRWVSASLIQRVFSGPPG